MTRVAIVGTGMCRFSKDSDESIESLLSGASNSALDSAQNMTSSEIDAVIVSTNERTGYLGPILAESIGAKPHVAQTVESLCISGTNALVSGYAHISAGLADIVLVSGADSFDGPGRVFEWDKSRGDDPRPIMWASRFAQSYKQKYDISDEQISTIAARAHNNAKSNPDAYEHDAYTPHQVLESELVAPSLRLFECSRACTGSASLILASERVAHSYSNTPVWISGIGQSTLGASLSTNPTFSELESASLAAADALHMAKINASDIDIAEVHDAFAVCEPMIIESIGMTERGKGAASLCEMFETSDYRVNSRGGIVGTGHPLGATGLAQTVQIAHQLAGTAGKVQVDSADTGLVHNMAAAGTSSTIIVLHS